MSVRSIARATVSGVRSCWPHDDSPGFSDYPENDIRTHRSMAKFGERAAGVVFFIGIWLAHTSSRVAVAAMVSFAALIYATSNRMRQQALRWELELQKEEER